MSLATVAMFATSGCGRAPASDQWREEVQLSDARVIAVKRGAQFRDQSPMGGPRSVTIIGTSVQIDGPSVMTPKWTSELTATDLNVNRETGRFVIVATTRSCAAWHRNGRPTDWRWAFELRDGRWDAVPVPENAPFATGNLLPISHDRYGGAQRSFVSLADKKKLISSADFVSPQETNERLRADHLAGRSRGCIESEPLQDAGR
jgi:hypothetical protein